MCLCMDEEYNDKSLIVFAPREGPRRLRVLEVKYRANGSACVWCVRFLAAMECAILQ